jgi:Zinc knuckle
MVNRDKLPDTLKGWQELATRLDHNRQMNDFDNTLQSGHGNFLYPDDIIRGNQPPPSRSGFQFQGCSIRSAEFPDYPEEILAQAFQRRTPLSDEEAAQRKQLNLCYRCGKEGHFSRECGTRTRPPAYDNRRKVSVRSIQEDPREEHPLITISRLVRHLEREQVKTMNALAKDF